MANHHPNPNRQYLERIRIAGFKSIRDVSIELRPDINILIGANGSGKSNFIETFDFVRMLFTQQLTRYVADKGGADSILYFGRGTTQSLRILLEYFIGSDTNATKTYEIRLHPNDQDQLVITSELAHYHERAGYEQSHDQPIAANRFESGLSQNQHIASRKLLELLKAYRIYHFHNAGPGSPPRQTANRADSVHLQSNGSNIAAWLYQLRELDWETFDLIESLVRRVSPFFEGFHPRPIDSAGLHIRLYWKARGRDKYFDIAAMSDGTVRFICLACLLLQPNPPPLILLDEPELGLHPNAIAILAGMLDSASAETQLIVSTQSVTLVNHFEPRYVWCVDRIDDATVLRNLENKHFIGWLEDYALGDFWEKSLVWEENGVVESGGIPQ